MSDSQKCIIYKYSFEFVSCTNTKLKKIKIVLTDIDGVLTDGGVYFGDKGQILKKFHIRDGMGVNILLRNNIPTIIVTKEKNEINKQWASSMNIKKIYQGIIKKETIIKKICKNFDVSPNQLAYIGDDVNDIELLNKVGFSATPNDGNFEVKKICDYICKSKGGEAAFREVADLVIDAQGLTKK